jgi:hypothetical protein
LSDRLIRAIKEALNRKRALYLAAAEKYKRTSGETFEIFVRHDLADHVRETLKNEPEFRDQPEKMIRSGGGGPNLEYFAPQTLLKWSEIIGAAKAVRRFKNALKKTKAPGFHVAALSAPKIDREIRLSNDVALVPFNLLPNSPQKERLWQRQFMREFGILQPPSAALVLRTWIDPLFYSAHGEPLVSADATSSPFEKLEHTRLCLTLIGPCAPIRLSGWFQFKDDTLNELSMAGNTSYPSPPEWAPLMIPKPEGFDAKKAQATVRGFSQLKGHDRDKVRRALERLLQTMCRRLPGDAAIDLSIALEALVGDVGAAGEHTWKVGMRSALLAGENLDVRKEVRDVIKGVYKIRSQVMHDGVVAKNMEHKAIDLVHKGILKTTSILTNVIKRGGLPLSWSDFELNNGKY